MVQVKHEEKGRVVDVPEAKVDYFLNRGWAVDVVVAEPDVAIPEGDPSDEWTVKQLGAFAEREGIDLAGATKKADVVAAITAARTSTTDPGADIGAED